MKSILKFTAAMVALTILFSFTSTGEKKVKCLIQMDNYTGEGAYIVVSLINPQGKYDQTLYVHGKDNEWYYELTDWWKFYGRNKTSLDGITGSTISGGERAMSVIKIDASKIGKGYKLRFESAVEAKNYYSPDIEFDLTTANLQKKYNGKGFIRYVRLLPQ
ncbi:MAG: DUF2271 domain-containing protein [Flavobacteriales bacterium]|nr:DUF2271 domain-containing protein [Flavobacteriales bacterium]